MYSTMFWCLLVVLLVFLALLHNHCYSSLHEPIEVSNKTRGEDKDSREMPCSPRMAHKGPVMQASNSRQDERKIKDTGVCL